MILTFAVNGTLLDETPFFEKLKALAEEPKLDAEQVAFAYRFYQARLQYGQAYQDAKTILKQTLMLMDVQFNDRAGLLVTMKNCWLPKKNCRHLMMR